MTSFQSSTTQNLSNNAFALFANQPPNRSNTWPVPAGNVNPNSSYALPFITGQTQGYAPQADPGKGQGFVPPQNRAGIPNYSLPPANSPNQGYGSPPSVPVQGYSSPPPVPTQSYVSPLPIPPQGYVSPPPLPTQGYISSPPVATQDYVSPPPTATQGYGIASGTVQHSYYPSLPANAQMAGYALPPNTITGTTAPVYLSQYPPNTSTSYGTNAETPSLGLWKYINGSQAAPQGTPTTQEMPRGLQIIFGLQDTKSPDKDILGRVVSKVPGSAQRRGGRSLEGVWRLVDLMSKSGSTPLESFSQFNNGAVHTITPSSSTYPLCPLQRMFTGTGAITNQHADTLCCTMGAQGLLSRLNGILGTNYTIEMSNLALLLNQYTEDPSADFGKAYGELRRGWFCDLARLRSRLQARKGQDSRLRQNAIERGRIVNPLIPPRRVWDLYSNRVLPFWVLHSTDIPRNLWAVSHSWVSKEEQQSVWTAVNGRRWPVPLPQGVDLDQVRIELLNLGAEYVWLDVLCLRQKIREAKCDGSYDPPLSLQEQVLEQQREQE